MELSMYYFIATIMFLNLEIFEKSVTGPFKSLENCVQYNEKLISLSEISPNIQILEAYCIRKQEV
jgi:predicted secreted protein